jgi:hypothetical protein
MHYMPLHRLHDPLTSRVNYIWVQITLVMGAELSYICNSIVNRFTLGLTLLYTVFTGVYSHFTTTYNGYIPFYNCNMHHLQKLHGPNRFYTNYKCNFAAFCVISEM